MANVGSVELEVKIALDKLRRDAAQANAELAKRLNDIEVKVNVDTGALQQATKDIDRSSNILAGVFQGIGQNIASTVIGSLQDAVGALQDVTRQAIGAAISFDSARAKVATLSNDADGVAKSMKELSKELGQQVSSTDLLNASYDVLSSGFSDAADINKILKASFLGAQGGFSDVGTVADATTTILNSYKLKASDAAKVVDVLAQTQDKGKITIDQYAAQVGRAASIASQAGVSFEEFSAAIATATAKGVPAESAVSGTRQAIVNLLKPTDEAKKLLEQFGISNSATALKSQGLVGILQQLANQGATTEQLSKIFSDVDAFSTVATLAGTNLKDFTANITAMDEASGKAAKSASQVANSIQGQMNAAVVKANEAMVELGQALLPVQSAFMSVFSAGIDGATENSEVTEILKKATEDFNKTLQENPEILKKVSDSLGRIADVLAQGVANGLEVMADYFSSDNFAQNVEALVKTFEALGAVLNFLTSVSQALSGAFAPIQTQFEALQGLAQIIEGVANAMSAFVAKAQEFGNAIADLPVIKQLREAIGVAQKLIDQLGLIGATPAQAQGGLAGAAQQAGQKVLQDTKPAVKPATKSGSAAAETTTPAKPLKDQLDADLKAIEATEAEKILAQQQAREQGKKTEQQAQDEILKIQRDAIDQQLAIVQEKLKNAKKGSEDEALLNEQLTKLRTESANLSAKAAENADKKREQAAKDALEAQKKREEEAIANLERNAAKAEAVINRSQQSRTNAILQSQLAGNLTDKQAQEELNKIQQDGVAQTIAARRQELAEVRKLRQQGLLSAEESAKREADLVDEIGSLTQQRLESEIAEQKRLREEALKTLEIQRNSKLEIANQALQQEGQGFQTEASLLSSFVELEASRNALAQARLQTQIAIAQSAGNEQKAAQLREIAALKEEASARRALDAKEQQIILSNKLNAIEAERAINSAIIARNEAQIELIRAQSEGVSGEELAYLQQIVNLRDQAIASAQAQYDAQIQINRNALEAIDNERQINKEKERQAELQRALERRQNGTPLRGDDRLIRNAERQGDRNLTGFNAARQAARQEPGSQSDRVVSAFADQFQSLRQPKKPTSPLSGKDPQLTVDRLRLQNPIATPQLTQTGLELQQSALSKAIAQPELQMPSNAIELGSSSIQALSAKFDQLIRATYEAAGRPNLTINRPDDVATAGRIYNDLAKANLRAVNL